MGRKNKRELLLDTAEELFSEKGFSATGINQITKDANVVTMTLYNNFSNKDELIKEMLIRRADRFRILMEQKIAKTPDDPCLQILAIFDVFDTWYRNEKKTKKGFTGCLFIKAALEFQSASDSVRKAAVRHKLDVLAIFKRLLVEANYEEANEIALEMHALIEGAITQAHILDNTKSFKRAKSMAHRLLELD